MRRGAGARRRLLRRHMHAGGILAISGDRQHVHMQCSPEPIRFDIPKPFPHRAGEEGRALSAYMWHEPATPETRRFA